MNEIILPDFVKFYNIGNEYQIIRKGNKFFIPQYKNKAFQKFETAYDYIQNELEGKPIFDIENILSEGMTKTSNSILISNGRMFLSSTYKQLVEGISEEYKNFIKTTKTKYDKNPDNLIYCWDFLNNHPCFWSRSADNPDYWNTVNGLDHLHISMWEEHNATKILLETGPYEGGIENDVYYEHIIPTVDTDLIVEADTFEEAIIELASKVRKHYTLSGNKI